MAETRRGDEQTTGTAVPRAGSNRRKAVALLAAVTTGFAGAAAVDVAMAAPAVEVVADLGPAGDGLTRLVVTSAAGPVTDEQLAALAAVPGVDSVQRLFDGSALVASQGLTPQALGATVPGATVRLSETASFDAGTVSDPLWSRYGYHLANNGSNGLNQAAVVGADVDAPTAWKAGTGQGLVVAVTDSGMFTSHADFAGGLWTNPGEVCGSPLDNDGNGFAGDCHGWNFYRANADVVNDGGNSHGTHVAGIIGARKDDGIGLAGVAPDVTIMPLAVGYGSSVDVSAASAAIVYAVDNGADVINASWGGQGQVPSILTQAVDYANSRGVFVVAAAGNSSLDIDANPFFPASMTQQNVVTVGSSDASDRVSGFSNHGAVGVDLFAPGSGIVATGTSAGSYVAMSGTSMAAPVVAAALALYKGRYPNATLPQLRQQLLADATPLPAFTGRSVTGARLSLTNLGNSASALTYGFTSMTAVPGPVTPQIVASGSSPAGDYSVRLGLGMEYAGEVLALSGQPITLAGVTATTDDTGEAVFALGPQPATGSRVLAPTTTLEAGRYVLTVQTFLGDTPLGKRYAAPLLVQPKVAPAPAPTSPAAPTTAPGAPTTPAAGPTSTAPRTTAPATSSAAAPTSAAPTGSTAAPTSSRPATAPSASVAPTSAAAPTSGAAQPTAAAPTTSRAPGSSAAPTSAATTAAPTSSPTATSAPTTAAPTSSAGAAPTGAAPTAAPTSSPAAGTTTPGAPSTGSAPGGSNTKTYPPQGPWQLTSVSPTTVSTAGNTTVTVTGTAIPQGAIVRVGPSGPGRVLSESTTRLTFSTPALAAGTYDVFVFGPDRVTYSVLPAALTYVAPVASPTSAPSSSAAPTPPAPDTAVPVPGGSSPAPGAGSTPAPPAQTVFAGPNGQRLVKSPVLARTAPAVWRQNCASACSGIAV